MLKKGLVLSSLLTLALAGCGGGGHHAAIPAAARGLQSIAIEVADDTNWPQIQFRAVGTYADATTRDLTEDVTWSSTVPDRFPIDERGVMVGTNNGLEFEIHAKLARVEAAPYAGNWD